MWITNGTIALTRALLDLRHASGIVTTEDATTTVEKLYAIVPAIDRLARNSSGKIRVTTR
jgi:hypothetical protein